MWRVASLLLAFTLFQPSARSLDPARQITQYAHSAWRLQDGYLGSLPSSVTQTTDGYIWIGTVSGVRRFDGVRFIDWAPPGKDRLHSSSVDKLLGTGDGSLWMLVSGSGVWQWKDGQLTKYLTDIPLEATSITDGGDGSVWVALMKPREQSGDVCQLRHGKSHCFGNEGLPHVCCSSIQRDPQGNLWIIGNYEVVKWSAHSGSSTVYTKPGPEVLGTNLTSLVFDADGSTWLGDGVGGGRVGLQHLTEGGWASLKLGHWDSSRLGVLDLLVDRNKAVWVGTDQGLYRVLGSQVAHFRVEDGLSGDAIRNLFEDREGNIWVASTKGLDCFRNAAVATMSAREGLSTDIVQSVFASKDGTLWAGGNGTLNAIRGDTIVPLRADQKLSGDLVTALFEDAHQNLLVGVDRTLLLFKNGSFKPLTRPDGSPFGYVIDMAADAENHIWAEIGRPRELLRLSGSRVDEVHPISDIPAARRIAIDAEGTLWLGLMTGDLARYRRGKLDVFPFPHGKDSVVRGLIVYHDGSVLGATASGLIGWHQGRRQVLTPMNGLPCEAINEVLEDHHANVWLYMQCGLVEVSQQEIARWWREPTSRLNITTFDQLDGVQPGQSPFPAAAESMDGKLWFTNGSALQVIDPDHLTPNVAPPPVHVEEIATHERSFNLSPNLVLPALTRDVAIRYTALSFVNPQRVRFRYKLEGQDAAWRDADTRREAFYTNLPPGKYRFRVIACNDNGLWNEAGDTYSFRIAPAYYQTTWFMASCVVAFGSLLGLLYVLRMRQAQAQLEQKMGARLEERERISRELHDTLLQGFQGLMLRFQSVLKVLPREQPGRDLLEKVLDRADEVLLEGRQSVRELRIRRTGEDFAGLISQCGDELAQGHEVAFNLDLVGTVRSLHPHVFEEAFRIAQEALFNAFQHSGASRIEVEVTYSDADLRVRIRDNGRGIPAQIMNMGLPGHWGLIGMRERAKGIHAQLDMWSNPGAGTEVELKVPGRAAYPRTARPSIWDRLRSPGRKGTRESHG